MENMRKKIVRSFSIAKNMYSSGRGGIVSSQESELQAGAEFLEANTVLSRQQENRLKQKGATVRNASSYKDRLKMNQDRERFVRGEIGKMSIEQLKEFVSFYQKMGKICAETLEKKTNGLMSEVTSF